MVEHGVSQWVDVTKVMFSRGNVMEKQRFGNLIKAGKQSEVVLDLYAGIGYYTLFAARQPLCEQVIACEWNPHAIDALEHNLQCNGVAQKVLVLQGDCRQVCESEKIVDCVDRVSLGLLPSSEGGWPSAMRALRKRKGGWLHVHGNVPCVERDQWARWVCHKLQAMKREWTVVLHRVTKVKSFAPRVDHYVADVVAGPRSVLQTVFMDHGLEFLNADEDCFVYCIWNQRPLQLQASRICPLPPSCALDPNGVLHQEWMKSR